MRDESFFFVRVREVCCHGPPVTCEPGDDVVTVAALMAARSISGVVVCRDGMPVGVITDRDIRIELAERGGDVRGIPASEVMTSSLVTLRPEDYVFEAIYKMARHNIHRLVVVGEEGRLAGIVTDTDIIALQTNTPLYFTREIESAGSLDGLQAVNRKTAEMVQFARNAGAGTRDVVRLIAHFNDRITQRAIELLEEQEGIVLPAGAAFLALGSEGRREQTLRTDQDSAMVYADDLSPADLAAVERFSVRLVEALVHIGVPPCPGGTMASNPQWRHSLSEWKQLLEQWISVLKPEHMVNFGMFQDLRAIHGDPAFQHVLEDHIRDAVRRQSLFLPYVARNIVRFPPPLGWFGRLRVETEGKHKGKLNLKKAGIFAITEGVSLLGLEAGIMEGSTWEKIEALAERHVMPRQDLDRLADAFTCLVDLRLQCQLRLLAAGEKPSNHLDPQRLSTRDLDRLREALTAVSSFLRSIRDRYQLDFISR